jgi:hypothetical protein
VESGRATASATPLRSRLRTAAGRERCRPPQRAAPRPRAGKEQQAHADADRRRRRQRAPPERQRRGRRRVRGSFQWCSQSPSSAARKYGFSNGELRIQRPVAWLPITRLRLWLLVLL